MILSDNSNQLIIMTIYLQLTIQYSNLELPTIQLDSFV